MTIYLESEIKVNIWLDIPSFSDWEINVITHEVRNKLTHEYCSTCVMRYGTKKSKYYYKAVRIGKKFPRQLHRLLMSAIKGRELLPHEFVCHENGMPFNNEASNLYLGDAKTNAEDRTRHKKQDMRILNYELTGIYY